VIDHNPGQFIFEEDHFLRRKWCWIVKRRNRHIDGVRIFGVFEKQMRAATRSETADPIRMRDFARFTFCNDKIFARHRSPGDIGRTGASPAIDAMTIDQSKRPTLQRVSCPAANASTSKLHTIRLAKTGESGNGNSAAAYELLTSYFTLPSFRSKNCAVAL